MVSPNLKFPMLLALAAFITQSLAVPIKPLCMDGSVIINEQSGTTFFTGSAPLGIDTILGSASPVPYCNGDNIQFFIGAYTGDNTKQFKNQYHTETCTLHIEPGGFRGVGLAVLNVYNERPWMYLDPLDQGVSVTCP